MKKFLNTRIASLLAAVVLAAPLAACGPTSTPVSIAAQAPNVEAVQTHAKGFTVGSMMSARTVYVFFDPQCPHCATLWDNSKPLMNQAKFIWIPVALLSKASQPQGAVLLAAKDPVATMNEHEQSMKARTGGISALGGVSDELKAAVDKNTVLLKSFGVNSIPFVMTKNAAGQLVTEEGAMPTDRLAALIGITSAQPAAPALEASKPQ